VLTFRRRSFCRGSPIALTIEGASTLGDRVSGAAGEFHRANGQHDQFHGVPPDSIFSTKSAIGVSPG
jgi:hypothetical protein